jgi:hypothetical protein
MRHKRLKGWRRRPPTTMCGGKSVRHKRHKSVQVVQPARLFFPRVGPAVEMCELSELSELSLGRELGLRSAIQSSSKYARKAR